MLSYMLFAVSPQLKVTCITELGMYAKREKVAENVEEFHKMWIYGEVQIMLQQWVKNFWGYGIFSSGVENLTWNLNSFETQYTE